MDNENPFVTPLFVPADRPERFAKAAASGADAIFLDLEDAVAPAQKHAARAALAHPGVLPGHPPLFVRLNALGTPWHEADLAAVCRLEIAGVVLPKAENAAQITALAALLGTGKAVIALIETATGLAAAREIARAGAARLAFGSIDFCADLGVAHTREALLMARAELVLASRLGGCVAPLDGVTTAIQDSGLVTDDARYASALGFGGKLCIHPAQIAPAKLGFAPAAAEIAWAERILAAGSDGAAAVDGAMVDAPVRARARAILRRRRA